MRDGASLGSHGNPLEFPWRSKSSRVRASTVDYDVTRVAGEEVVPLSAARRWLLRLGCLSQPCGLAGLKCRSHVSEHSSAQSGPLSKLSPQLRCVERRRLGMTCYLLVGVVLVRTTVEIISVGSNVI